MGLREAEKKGQKLYIDFYLLMSEILRVRKKEQGEVRRERGELVTREPGLACGWSVVKSNGVRRRAIFTEFDTFERKKSEELHELTGIDAIVTRWKGVEKAESNRKSHVATGNHGVEGRGTKVEGRGNGSGDNKVAMRGIQIRIKSGGQNGLLTSVGCLVIFAPFERERNENASSESERRRA